MKPNPRVIFITNLCTHYVLRLFEILAARFDIRFFFTGGDEAYWEKNNRSRAGRFEGTYLKCLRAGPLKIIPGLFAVIFGACDVFIKTLDGKLALPLVFLAARLRRKPFILWTGLWHHPQTAFHRRTFGITRMIYRRSDAVVVYGEHIRRYLTGMGIPSEKIFTAPHAVDNTLFDQDVDEDRRHSYKTSLGLAGKFVVLYVGRLEPCKGLDVLVEAMAGWAAESTALLIVGRGSLRHWLQEQAGRYGLTIRFCDYVENTELYRCYAVCDVFVLPSVTTPDFKEPWGLVVNEAMNQRRPVVVTDAVGAGAGGLVEDGVNGFIVPERDARALGKAIRRLYDDPALARRTGEAAGRKIQGWTQEKMAEGFVRALAYVTGHEKTDESHDQTLLRFSAQQG